MIINDLPDVPSIDIYKSSNILFSKININELDFAPIEPDNNSSVYAIIYPSLKWSEVQELKTNKIFHDNQKTYYTVTNKIIGLTEQDPLARDDELMLLYYSIDKNKHSYCHAIHEMGNFQDPEEITYYKDGPEYLIIRDNDTWESQSLVFKNNRWVLDIKCNHNATSGWIVRINNKEYNCIEVSKFAVPYRGEPLLSQQPEFINKYYFNKDGHCILLRRYMGPIWEKWRKEFWEKLQESEFIEEKNERFHLYMDYVPARYLD